MFTKDQFITRWRFHVAGVITCGCHDFKASIQGPFATAGGVGKAVCSPGDEAARLLGQLYDDLARETNKDPVKPTETVNGPVKGTK